MQEVVGCQIQALCSNKPSYIITNPEYVISWYCCDTCYEVVGYGLEHLADNHNSWLVKPIEKCKRC